MITIPFSTTFDYKAWMYDQMNSPAGHRAFMELLYSVYTRFEIDGNVFISAGRDRAHRDAPRHEPVLQVVPRETLAEAVAAQFNGGRGTALQCVDGMAALPRARRGEA